MIDAAVCHKPPDLAAARAERAGTRARRHAIAVGLALVALVPLLAILLALVLGVSVRLFLAAAGLG